MFLSKVSGRFQPKHRWDQNWCRRGRLLSQGLSLWCLEPMVRAVTWQNPGAAVGKKRFGFGHVQPAHSYSWVCLRWFVIFPDKPSFRDDWNSIVSGVLSKSKHFWCLELSCKPLRSCTQLCLRLSWGRILEFLVKFFWIRSRWFEHMPEQTWLFMVCMNYFSPEINKSK